MGNRIITLGTWDSKPIEWIVLKEKNFGALVVSQQELFQKQFSTIPENQFSASLDNRWINSKLRKVLNGSFFDSAFTDTEKKEILNVCLKDVGNSKDNIFILGRDEAGLIGDDSARNRISSGTWWLRTPRSNGTLWGVGRDGMIDRECWVTDTYFVHPAMYIKHPGFPSINQDVTP